MVAFARRTLLVGAPALAVGCAAGSTVDPGLARRQPGVCTPEVPQTHVEVSVWDAPAPDLPALRAAADRLSVAGRTVTLGLGPRHAEVGPLPAFPGDRVEHTGGDLVLQVCSDDADAVRSAAAEFERLLGGAPVWRQHGFRGAPRPDGTARNVLGFVDGIVVPRGEAELSREVWREDGSTIAVVRRVRLDVEAFTALPVTEQERVIGRRKDSAEPLSGGAGVDLDAKTPDGEYLIPVDAHVRRAHPRAAGTGTMLRRSYSYDNGPGDRGLLFISFQRLLATFVNTAHRMAEGDALLRYAVTTASAAFLVPPAAPGGAGP